MAYKFLSLVCLLLATANAFKMPASRFTTNRLRMSSENAEVAEGTEVEQEVKDLNLEEMFEVFDAADKSIPSEKVISSSFDASKAVGSSAPLGFFDPAGFTLDIEEDQYKLYQEAETKHGRVAMLAFVGLVVGELINPFFGGQITGPAIYQFQQADELLPVFWVFALQTVAWVEGQTIIDLWQPLEDTFKEPLGVAKLSKAAVPGDLGFDPLGLKPKTPQGFATMKTKELNNGRLAMIGVLGFIVQELITGEKIF